MFGLILFLVEFCKSSEQFLGNRTHYPNLQIRNGSLEADTNFASSGKGNVKISFTDPNFYPNQNIRNLQQSTATRLELTVSYLSDRATDCSFSGDVLIMDSTQVGAYEECLLDIYAWDFDFASAIDPVVVTNGLYKDKLLALPLEFYRAVLIYNKEYLATHGYDTVPNDLGSFTEMIKYIQINERGAENYNLKGFAAAFADKQELVSWVSELTTGVGGFVFKDRFHSIATGNFSNALSHVITWIEDSIFEAEDFNRKWSDVLDLFKNRKVIFIHSNPVLAESIEVTFDWDMTPMPGLTFEDEKDGRPFTRQGIPSGSLMGTFVGINKNSLNPSGALKLVQGLTSPNYQKELISNSTYQREYLIPFHQTLITDPEFCSKVGSKCNSDSVAALRPSTIAGSQYGIVTSIIYNEILSVFQGLIDVGTGIDNIDDKLRFLLNYPARNSTLDNFDDVAPTKASKFKNLMEQVLLLLFCVGVGLTVAILYKRKNEAEEKLKSEMLPMHDLSMSENASLVKNIERN